jgi:hypothetical protein
VNLKINIKYLNASTELCDEKEEKREKKNKKWRSWASIPIPLAC